MRWLLAFFRRQRGTLTKVYPWTPPQEAYLQVTCDASPWGIGGVLFVQGAPAAWFADDLQQCDLDRFQATKGDSAFTTVWEALAILVALRLWRQPRHLHAAFAVRSDSLGALRALSKKGSGTRGVGLILRELSLEEAELGLGIRSLTHIPGMSNTWADALSRLTAPEAKALPGPLKGIPRSAAPPRTKSWWLTL